MVNKFQPKLKGNILQDAVTVFTDFGKAFHGWETVRITKNLESICNGFTMELHDRFQESQELWTLKPGVRVEINIGNERVFTGYVETMEPSFSAGQRNFSIGGRSLAGDLVDCSHDGSMEFTNIALDELAKELVSPFGLKVFLSVTPSVIDRFAVKPGEKVFEALDRAARLQGFFWVSTREGNIRLTRAAKARSFSELHQDVNIKEASLKIDTTKRFSEYKVKGQTFGTDTFNGEKAASPEGSALDNGVERHRPLILIAEGAVDTDKATTRAQWEAANRIAQGHEVTVAVQGWQQEDGSLWGINQIVRLKSRFLGINRDMLITNVEHVKSISEGTATAMSLVRTDSFNPQPVFEKKNDPLSDLGPGF